MATPPDVLAPTAPRHGIVERTREWWRGIGSPRARAALLVILVLGTVLRAGWVAYAGVEPKFGTDPQGYLLLGEQLAHGNGYTNPLVDPANKIRAEQHLPLLKHEPTAFYPPGYPAFIAAVAVVVWHTPIPDRWLVRTIGYMQVILGLLTILMAFALARRVFGAQAALVAAGLVAFYPNLITLTATLQFETLFIALSLATTLVLYPIAVDEHPRRGRIIAGGAMTGVVALVHPPVAFLLVALVLTRLIARRGFRSTVAIAATLALAMVFAMSPWIIRNAVQLHAFVPTATGAGPALCMSRNPEATGNLDTGILVRQCQPKTSTGSLAADDVAVNSYATSTAIRWVLHHPGDELRMWFWRTKLAYRVDTTGLSAIGPSMDPRWYDVAAFAHDSSSFVALAFAVFGVLIIVRRRTPGGIFLVGCALVYAAMPIVLFGDPRYRVPAEPFFLILAAAGVLAAYRGAQSAIAVPEPRLEPSV